MKQTVNLYDFRRAFEDYGRTENFSYPALDALFAWFEEYEEGTGQEIELDVIAICCDFSEYDAALEAAKEYGWEPDEDQDEEEQEEAALEWLQEQTTVIEADNGHIIIQGF